MKAEIEAARHLLYHAARLKDAGAPFSLEASMASSSRARWRCARPQRDPGVGGYGRMWLTAWSGTTATRSSEIGEHIRDPARGHFSKILER
jgi:hypothetical protein